MSRQDYSPRKSSPLAKGGKNSPTFHNIPQISLPGLDDSNRTSSCLDLLKSISEQLSSGSLTPSPKMEGGVTYIKHITKVTHDNVEGLRKDNEELFTLLKQMQHSVREIESIRDMVDKIWKQQMMQWQVLVELLQSRPKNSSSRKKKHRKRSSTTTSTDSREASLPRCHSLRQ